MENESSSLIDEVKKINKTTETLLKHFEDEKSQSEEEEKIAEEKAAAEAAAQSQQEKEEQAAKEEEEKQEHERLERTEEIQTAAYEKLDEISSNLSAIELKDYADDLEELKSQNATLITNTTVQQQEIEKEHNATVMSFTADAAIILLVLGLIPCYLAYRMIRSHFSLLNHIL